jgi:hypothetical protein
MVLHFFTMASINVRGLRAICVYNGNPDLSKPRSLKAVNTTLSVVQQISTFTIYISPTATMLLKKARKLIPTAYVFYKLPKSSLINYNLYVSAEEVACAYTIIHPPPLRVSSR